MKVTILCEGRMNPRPQLFRRHMPGVRPRTLCGGHGRERVEDGRWRRSIGDVDVENRPATGEWPDGRTVSAEPHAT